MQVGICSCCLPTSTLRGCGRNHKTVIGLARVAGPVCPPRASLPSVLPGRGTLFMAGYGHTLPDCLHRPCRLRSRHPAAAVLRAALRRVAVRGHHDDGLLLAGAVLLLAALGAA